MASLITPSQRATARAFSAMLTATALILGFAVLPWMIVRNPPEAPHPQAAALHPASVAPASATLTPRVTAVEAGRDAASGRGR